MHNYSSYDYEWINGVNLPHVRTLIKAYGARKVVEVQAATHVKANKPVGKRTIISKKLPPLIDDNDIEMDDKLVMWREDELTNPLDTPRYSKLTKNKRRMTGRVSLNTPDERGSEARFDGIYFSGPSCFSPLVIFLGFFC